MVEVDWPAGWEGWSESAGKIVVAYRPDVFDSQSFPAPCLPTLYLTKGKRRRKPGARTNADDPWYVTLFLEPEIHREQSSYPDREAAVAGARDLAERFARGDVEYRDLYQVPREDYLDKLDELTGRGT